MYKIRISKIYEDGDEEVLSEENAKSLAVLMETDDDRVGEYLVNTCIRDIANYICNTERFRKAALLAAKILPGIIQREVEDKLIDLILGGINDGSDS